MQALGDRQQIGTGGRSLAGGREEPFLLSFACPKWPKHTSSIAGALRSGDAGSVSPPAWWPPMPRWAPPSGTSVSASLSNNTGRADSDLVPRLRRSRGRPGQPALPSLRANTVASPASLRPRTEVLGYFRPELSKLARKWPSRRSNLLNAWKSTWTSEIGLVLWQCFRSSTSRWMDGAVGSC